MAQLLYSSRTFFGWNTCSSDWIQATGGKCESHAHVWIISDFISLFAAYTEGVSLDDDLQDMIDKMEALDGVLAGEGPVPEPVEDDVIVVRPVKSKRTVSVIENVA